MELNTYIFIACVVVCVALAVLFIVIRAKNGACVRCVMAKTIASFAFVMTGAYALTGFASNMGNFIFILLGLICGLVGDILLELKVVYKDDANIYLPYGMLAFGLGHILYFTAINLILDTQNIETTVPFIIAVGIACVGTILIIALSKKVMKLDFGEFFVHSAIYTFILIFVTAFAIILSFSMPSLFIMAGGLLAILISDMVLSMQYFGGKEDSKLLHILNHSIYYLGQILIAVFIFCYAII